MAENIAARALARHASSACKGDCTAGGSDLSVAATAGAYSTVLIGEVKLGVLRLAHARRKDIRAAWSALERALDAGLSTRLRPWIRRYAAHAATALLTPGGGMLLARLADSDPEGWREGLIEALVQARESDRSTLLRSISKHANKNTIAAMQHLGGTDIAEARRHLQRAAAARLYLKTFGGVSLHRGDWTGPALQIDKKRVRMLLAVLAARSHTTLTRDMAIDLIWPDADPDAAINNLNQTVFQLRRYIDPSYKGGESPEYIISSSEQIALNPELVRTDLDEVRRLDQRVRGADWASRQAAVKRVIALIRGEFLADLPYEGWTAVQQVTIHSEVRDHLLPVATTGRHL